MTYIVQTLHVMDLGNRAMDVRALQQHGAVSKHGQRPDANDDAPRHGLRLRTDDNNECGSNQRRKPAPYIAARHLGGIKQVVRYERRKGRRRNEVQGTYDGLRQLPALQKEDGKHASCQHGDCDGDEHDEEIVDGHANHPP